jgi:hypothetical protein
VTHLRKITLEELERRNYSETTTQAYLHAIEDFQQHCSERRRIYADDRLPRISI